MEDFELNCEVSVRVGNKQKVFQFLPMFLMSFGLAHCLKIECCLATDLLQQLHNVGALFLHS